jgi:hypothetical protein
MSARTRPVAARCSSSRAWMKSCARLKQNGAIDPALALILRHSGAKYA